MSIGGEVLEEILEALLKIDPALLDSPIYYIRL
jgi:hypothetical protein